MVPVFVITAGGVANQCDAKGGGGMTEHLAVAEAIQERVDVEGIEDAAGIVKDTGVRESLGHHPAIPWVFGRAEDETGLLITAVVIGTWAMPGLASAILGPPSGLTQVVGHVVPIVPSALDFGGGHVLAVLHGG